MPHDDPFAGKTIDADWGLNLDTQGTYTPELTAVTTDPDLGEDGIAEGAWHLNGHLITGWARFLFSGAGLDAGSGIYRISPPFAADASIMAIAGAGAAGFVVGGGRLRDDSNGANSLDCTVQFSTASAIQMAQEGTNAAVTDSSPIAWAEGDRISIQFMYIADPTAF